MPHVLSTPKLIPHPAPLACAHNIINPLELFLTLVSIEIVLYPVLSSRRPIPRAHCLPYRIVHFLLSVSLSCSRILRCLEDPLFHAMKFTRLRARLHEHYLEFSPELITTPGPSGVFRNRAGAVARACLIPGATFRCPVFCRLCFQFSVLHWSHPSAQVRS